MDIEEILSKPKKYEIDGERVELHSLKDIVAALEYKRKNVKANPWKLMARAKIQTQGAGR